MNTERISCGVCAKGLMIVFTCLVGIASGCGDKDGKGGTDSRMSVSSKEFNSGRSDGRRDAKASWTEDSAAWMWTWMTSEGYQQGYQQGWTEGRAEVKFRKEQDKARKDTRHDEAKPASSPEQSNDSSGLWGE